VSVEDLDHLYMESPQFEATIAFWRSIGFEVAAEWGEDGHRACRLTSNEAVVVLAEGEAPVPPTVHFGISAPEAMQERLAADEHVDVVTPLEDTHWGTRWIRVRDPDGNVYALESGSK
jgi:catechol 2,3-dioxygenase-like lactoylglutathione lyase family enzyme